MSKNLRAEMPETAAFIDACRAAFGAEQINASIKAGLAGQPTFYARENGHEIGTRAPYSAENSIKLSDTLIGPINAPAAQHGARAKGK